MRISIYPWGPFRTFLHRFFWALAFIFVGLALSFRWVAASGESPNIELFFLLGFLLSLTSGAWILWSALRPLARLRHAVHTGEFWFSEELDLAEDEPEEWAEISQALQKMSSSLEKSTQRSDQDESEVETLMQGISDAVLAVDRKGQPLFYNKIFKKVFGVDLEEGKTPFLSEMIRAPEVLRSFQQAIRDGESASIEVGLYVQGEALPRHYAISIAPLRVHEWSQTYGALGIFHDVTELKRVDQMRIDFVANVSHEIRTPLTSIKGFNQALQADLVAQRMDSVPRFLDGISRNVDRMIALVSDLLDLSSLESGGELERGPIDLAALTEHVVRGAEDERLAKSQNIEWRSEVEILEGDEHRIEQVLTNLLHNAIKYTPEKAHIQVLWAKENDQVILRVKDNGPGISPEHLPRLFERFYRVDRARSRELGGTGLGLSIVKHIMRRHGGTAEVHSEPGKGTEFICRF